MRGLPVIIFTLTFCVCAAFAQTASDIELRYGKPAKVYSVSEHIWMTPEYAADGQICLARLYPKRVSDNANHFFPELPSDELMATLDRLAPPDTRGAREYEDFAVTEIGGGVAGTTYPYKKVRFTFLRSFKFDPAAWERAVQGETISLSEAGAPPPEKKAVNDARPADGISKAASMGAEVVEIRWRGRKCVGR